MIGTSWKIYIGLFLVALSAILSTVHFAVFRDARTLFFYLALDVVFMPVQVIFVTFIIEQLLTEREQKAMLQKLNMVIGAFYSEVGRELLLQFRRLCSESSILDRHLKSASAWDVKDFKEATTFINGFVCNFETTPSDLSILKSILINKRPFILALLQNPNLLEHDKFGDLLWAISHLTEELIARNDFTTLPDSDIVHIHGDVNRAFGKLIIDWLDYMLHLKTDYPYLFSLAVRTNPFDPDASAIIK